MNSIARSQVCASTLLLRVGVVAVQVILRAPLSEFARDGGLLSYGIGAVDLWPRAASYVDRILRGAKPADLPVQFPTKFEMTVNLKTAKALGLTIPETLLATADEVIQ